ncbi:universal stress protein [Cryobacterium sp. 1639]|uniref:universal stress protein n=1 Tax=Cryobacterium inferilacus TaxID=2866629 RepID=UPI001C73B108|nr:universal stress protein [Cryobacterium sp. 1639]MBX0299175.1 universal stress protein [Cryobacterium sp. 1639]
MARKPPPIVVGVTSGQPDAVVLAASEFATQFGAELICASVDPSRYLLEERPDGSMTSASFDPDSLETTEMEFDPGLRAQIERVLHGRPVEWSTRALAGDPAKALGHLAGTVRAVMIVVGSREPTVRHSLRYLFLGSVAMRLSHGQQRPVVIIPLNPIPFGEEPPWDEA